MENKGCITCRKCKQVRSNFFCGRTRLSQKQLYNEHGFCSDYEPEEQIEKTMTNDEWRRTCSAKEFAEFLNNITYDAWFAGRESEMPQIKGLRRWDSWLKEKHE